jgi:hypothetical protein
MRQEFAITNFLKSAKRGSPLLWWSAIAMVFGMVICFALPLVDDRLLYGVSVWEKPAKFFLSLAVHTVTVAWALSLLARKTRGVKIATVVMLGAAWFEMAYMIFRALRGEASHFNQTTVFAIIMYALMGFGALTLTGTSAFIGWKVWRERAGGLTKEAAGLGLMAGAVLGTIAGAYLGGHTSHWIGGDQTDVSGLAFFHWSTTGGDLRVAHFIGLHATQFVPLAALSGSRAVVYGVAIVTVALTAATFALAVMGVPLLALQ